MKGPLLDGLSFIFDCLIYYSNIDFLKQHCTFQEELIIHMYTDPLKYFL